MTDTEDSQRKWRSQCFEEHRGLLFSVAYRMLGCATDADEMVKEALLRWQSSPESELLPARPHLLTIVSGLCIDHLRSARMKRKECIGQWLREPLLSGAADGGPSEILRMDQSLSTAFLVLLERLPPMDRVAFLLHGVFGCEVREIARMLAVNELHCRQILCRARRTLEDERPGMDRAPRNHEHILHEFLDAATRADFDGLIALLADDVVFQSDGRPDNSGPTNLCGAGNVARAILGALQRLVPLGLVRQVTEIDRQPGIVSYLHGRPHAFCTMEIADGFIRKINLVCNPEKLEHLPKLPSAPC